MGSDEDGAPRPVVVRFTQDANPLWQQWYDTHYQEMEAADFPDILVGPWSKLVAYAARLALVIHMLRKVCGEVQIEDVDAESLRRAIRLIDYFKSHARVVYRQLQLSSDRRTQRVVDWIKKHGNECTSTQLIRNNVAGIAKKSEAEKVLRELQDLGLGDCEVRRSANNRDFVHFVLRPQSGQIGSDRTPTRSETSSASA
jgi:hypothetical protein